jgi:hypothetical protein
MTKGSRQVHMTRFFHGMDWPSRWQIRQSGGLASYGPWHSAAQGAKR